MATNRPVLKAETRKVLGRKVKKLRAEGLVPVSTYGKDVKSISLQVDGKEIAKVLEKVGETGLIDVLVDKDKEAKVVLMKNPQFDPITDLMIHIDFHQVKLTEKVTVSVPVELAGEAPVVGRSEGVLVQILDEVEIEALPMDLPEKFVLDVSKFEKVGDTATIADLKIDEKKITLKVSADQVLVKIESAVVEEKEEEVVAPVEGEEVAAEGGAEASADGETKPAEGEARPAEGGDKPEAKEEAKPEEK
ncbi:MAG: 50S ribosomal protein L25 [Patescibacteria group bacterium]